MSELKQRIPARVISQSEISSGIFSLVIEHEALAGAEPGQFMNLYTEDGAHLMPRPISVCEADAGGRVRLVYRVAGFGTKSFASLVPGDEIPVIGPLGNGFFAAISGEIDRRASKALFIGGGIGIPPMLGLGTAWPGAGTAVLGFRNETFLIEDFKDKDIPVLVASEDGSIGERGTVIDAIRAAGERGDVIFACGPKPMLKAVRDMAREWEVPCYLSLEERMACGVGACLGCVVDTVNKDEHSKVHNRRVCADGPVFAAEEVRI